MCITDNNEEGYLSEADIQYSSMDEDENENDFQEKTVLE
jgi:hypothetical protein